MAGHAATEWVSFLDDNGTTWLFDLTFLSSNWSCTFGVGCPGTEPGDNGRRGCCAHGAYLTAPAERSLVAQQASRLTAAQWQNHHLISTDDDVFTVEDGEISTRTVDDACVFLNDESFAGGHGCALHIGAVDAGELPLDWKPEVCWQVPFRLETHTDDIGTVTMTLRAWRRTDWGEGGQDFDFWCTDHLTVGLPGHQTWRHHIDELSRLTGPEPVAMLVDYLEKQEARSRESAVFLQSKSGNARETG